MAERSTKSRGLGRGLSALMADVAPASEAPTLRPSAERTLPIEQIKPNPKQPRRSFNEGALDELAASIASKGIIQPLIVRVSGGDFEIVAGERRWRAAQIAKLHEVPVIVREFTDVEMLEVAIIENIQRAELNAIDEASGYRQLVEAHGHTQEQLAGVLGKSRSHIANLMRLLTLPSVVQAFVETGELSSGHARALVGNPNAESLAKDIIKRKLSVRETERLVKGAPKTRQRLAPSGLSKPTKDADTVAIEKELSATLGMSVIIEHSGTPDGDGKMILKYRSLDQLDDLLRALSG
jgi:ParB family chromosome partitioning protein